MAKRHKQELGEQNKIAYVDHNPGVTMDGLSLLSANTFKPVAGFMKDMLSPGKEETNPAGFNSVMLSEGKRGHLSRRVVIINDHPSYILK